MGFMRHSCRKLPFERMLDQASSAREDNQANMEMARMAKPNGAFTVETTCQSSDIRAEVFACAIRHVQQATSDQSVFCGMKCGWGISIRRGGHGLDLVTDHADPTLRTYS